MIEIGTYNMLKVVRVLDTGISLDAGDDGELLLPANQAPEDCREGQTLKVFLYVDSEGRAVPTTAEPYARVGTFAGLKAVDILPVGAFLDWGLPKDLFVPISEQKEPMEAGQRYVVYVYKDDRRGRVAASSKLDAFLEKEPASFKENDRVALLICHQTDLGYNAIINDAYWGLLYQDEVFQTLEYGQRVDGFIKKIREDGKIDVSLQRQGYQKTDELEERILARITQDGGTSALTDKSSPEVIYEVFGVSKKKYKMALGALYKARRIRMEGDTITLQ